MNRETLTNVGVIALMTAVMMIPALVNGFPFVDYDSMSYLSTAIDRVIPENRPVYYSIFAALFHWGVSPWPTALAQCAILATVIWHFARMMFGIVDARVLVGIAAVLMIATTAPYYAGYMTPDIFTSVLMLALLMLGLCWDRLSLVVRGLYIVTVAACVAFHYGNTAIALGANVVLGALALLGWRPAGKAWPRFAAITGGALLGMAALTAATTYDHGKLDMSPSSGSFYLARLLDDGSALQVLNEQCPTRGWHVCSELPTLNAYAEGHRAHPENPQFKESVADWFLWGGALQRLGDFEAVEPEADQIIPEAWKTHGGEQFGATAKNAIDQFVSFQFGEFLHPWLKEPGPTIQRIFGDGAYRAYQRSMQQRGVLSFGLFNIVANLLIAASALLLIWQAWLSWRGDKQYFYLTVALLCFLLGNAFVCGVMSGVFANYQARVIWLVPLMGLLMAAKLYWKPKA